MGVQFSVKLRNGALDSYETNVGASPWLDIRSGAQPVNCAAVDAGTEIWHYQLPADWMAAAATGSKAKAGTWSGTADAAGTAGHFRIKVSADTDCDIQGSVTATGGGGDMEADNISIALGQAMTVSTFTLTAGNA